jgi:hypothetical protein
MRIGRHERHSWADRRRCVCGLPLHSRLLAPQGADAPRSCVGVRTSAGEKNDVCDARTLPRAAGVSPPWVCKPRLQLQCDEFRRFEFACDECVPRGADAPRSCVGVRTSAGEKTMFAMHERFTKSGGRKPAVGGQMRIGRHERHSWADRRRCVCGLPLHSRLLAPRGADAPRSCVAARSFAGEITPFAMYERTVAGAAGVSPPWSGKRACNGEMTIFSVDHR